MEYTVKLSTGKTVEFDTDDMSEKAIRYLMEYGVRQCLNDSIAGLRKELKDEGTDEAEITDQLNDAIDERWASVLDGTVGTRASGPRLRGLDAFIRDVAVDEIKANAAKLDMKLPKGEEYTKFRDAYIAKHRERLTPIAQERMDAVTAGAEDAAALLEGLI
jgi:hypothetical protein